MQFLRENRESAVQAVARRIGQELQAGKRVLWLVCGGSNIAAEVEIMQELHKQAEDRLEGLAILPTDERYGPSGHPDSNYRQLQEAGFKPGAATWVDVLTRNVPIEQTVSFYTDVAATAFANAGAIIGLFGMGANAHIAGIQPGSPAIAPGAASVVGYNWEDFTRLTLTVEMFKQLQVAYAFVYGDKEEALRRLQKNDEPFEKVPAKVLYDIPEAYVYNEYITSEE